MRGDHPGNSTEEVKALTETEIQDRLYGHYLGKRKTLGQAVSSPDPEWTGAQILSGEVKRLREELIALRKEHESLRYRLRSRPAPLAVKEKNSWGSLGAFLGCAIIVGVAGFLLFFSQRLQASPVSGEGTPFTVQVAIFDSQPPAQRALSNLLSLGYEAFLVERPWRSGKSRWRIYVGSFVTRQEADQERTRLAGDPNLGSFSDAFVRLR
ncbi:MAG: SPOR domain-containing protein [Candidatus Omnitrophica bacterium]|nr:SPOR domain-containing protein [Candidatus Omnitrophota bacterium]